MSTRNAETYHPYFAPNTQLEALQKHLADMYKYTANPRWIVAKDKITASMDDHFRSQLNQPEVIEYSQAQPIVFDLARVCYHCDAIDGVSGVVPLCRKCR